MGFKGLGIALSLALVSPAWAEQAKTLVDLAAQLPTPPVRSPVRLVDLAAAREQTDDLADGKPTPFPHQYLNTLDMPEAMRSRTLGAWPADEFEEVVGFRPEAITAVAGWTDTPEAPLVMLGSFNEQKIDAALTARGYAVRDGDDGPVWHRGEDFNISADVDEPFSEIGASGRLALRGDALLYARSWAGIERQLGKGERLGDDPDIAAFLEIAYSELFPGVPLQMQILRYDAVQAPGFPAPRKIGVLHWQDGTETTAALLLSYALSSRNAAKAAQIAEAGLDQPLPGTERTLTEVLGDSASVRVLERGGRNLVVLSATKTVERAEAFKLKAIAQNPHAMVLAVIRKHGLKSAFAAE